MSRIEEVTTNLKNALVQWSLAISPAVVPAGKDASQAKLVAAVLGFDEQYRKSVIDVIKAIKDVDLTDQIKQHTAKNIDRIPFVLVVPNTGTGHNYPAQQPSMMICAGIDMALRSDATVGNNQPKPVSSYRSATEAETRAYWDSFFNALATTYLKPEVRAALEASTAAA